MSSYKLVISIGGKVADRVDYDIDSVTIGRSKECNLVLDNLGVSRKHCEILNAEGAFTLRDLNSNNGTYVNGRRVRQHNLNDNDEIGIGKFQITFQTNEARPVEVDMGEGEAGEGGMTMAIDKSEMDRRQRERASAIKGHLIVRSGESKRTIFLDQSLFTMGNAPTCDFQVKGGFFSGVKKKHAIIFRDPGGFRLIDTSNKGSTYVNGTGIDDERLKDGDVIKIGGTQLTFMVGTPVG